MTWSAGLRGLPEPGTLDVLFVAYGGGHIQAIVPVAHALQARGYKISVFAVTTAIAVAEAESLPHFSYSDLPQAEHEDVLREGARLAAAFPPNGPVPFEETRAYLGINFMDLVQQHGSDEAHVLYEAAGRQNFSPITTMTDCLQYLRPKLVVATNSPRSEQAALQAAGNLGLPSLCIVDMFALQEIAWLKTPGFSTKVCVLNEGVRDMFLREGRPADEIVITGNPAFDGIHDPTVIHAGRELRQMRGWNSERFTVLYASTPEPARHPFTGEAGDPTLPHRVEQRLREIFKERQDLELVLRRHPSEDQNIEPGDRIYTSSRSEDVNALIHAVDLVVVTCSTVGLQAYLAGVPMVSVECSVISKDAPYGDFGMSRKVLSIEALEAALLDEISLQRAAKSNKITAQDNGPALATSAICAQVVQLLEGIA